MVDEGLLVLDALGSGNPVNHTGDHYHVVCEAWSKPTNEKCNPIWIARQWPGGKPFRCAPNWHGVVRMARDQMEGAKITPSELKDLLSVIDAEQKRGPEYDVVMIGLNPS